VPRDLTRQGHSQVVQIAEDYALSDVSVAKTASDRDQEIESFS
jgi:hypothetical protein